ncbi:hypothetical protein RhiTH_010398 [Rhizoctonia solani]|uniref:DUF6589 domain-containing protein n=1 Tax=Rhizoctonia solani TaxID=456999 RepID=A0A8H7H656_9AGAM|nr:hypothetical protein RHS04_05701 [Rhizoctonia solani]KAF8757244.1 hypothetical protein RHS01_04170 [Rhizoctonia solani]
MLVNMTGKKKGWKEIDLLQEHMNYWIKVIYKARGPNATWKWLAEILPCISTLRELASQVNASLAPRNSNHHTTPNLQADLEALTKSLAKSKVHECDPTRCLDKTLQAKDALSLGLQSLAAHNSPIKEFNRDRFGARNTASYASRPSNDGDEREAETSKDADMTESQIQDLSDVVVDNGDGEEEDPFDFD